MKTKLSLLVALLFTYTVKAYDFKYGELYYNIKGDGIVEVAVNYSQRYEGDITIPSNVFYEGKEYIVTSIGASAFEDCLGLTSITMPQTITTIGSHAFCGAGLISIEVPNSVTSVGSEAFLM